MPIRIFIDADACAVTAEIYRFAERRGPCVFVASDSVMAIPSAPWIQRVFVSNKPDAADDRIVPQAGRGNIVAAADVPPAARGVRTGASAIGPTGRASTEE